MLLPALVVFAVAGALLAVLEDRLHRRAHTRLSAAWVDGFALPLGRVLALMGFIACAYPALYGLRGVPSFAALLQGGTGRFDHLLTLLFLAGLLLPAVAPLRHALSLVLPLQGMVGVAVVARWCAASVGAPLSLWPSAPVWLALIAVAGLVHLIARLLVRAIADEVLREDARDLLLLWLQAPVLLIYGRFLGAQFP